MPWSSIVTRRSRARSPPRPPAPRRAARRRGRGRAPRRGRTPQPPRRRRRRVLPTVPSGSPSTRASVLFRERPTRTGRPMLQIRSSPRIELEVLVGRLAEADPRVEADVLLRDPRRDRDREPLLEEAGDLADDVVVARLDLHRARLPLHVHQADVRARVGDHAGELRIAAQGGDVVDERGAELERPRAPPRPSSCRSRPAGPRALRARAARAAAPRRATTGVGAGTGRLATDVDERRTLGEQPPRRLRPRRPDRRCSPPSEKLSGVTLTTPITAGSRPTLGERMDVSQDDGG